MPLARKSFTVSSENSEIAEVFSNDKPNLILRTPASGLQGFLGVVLAEVLGTVSCYVSSLLRANQRGAASTVS